MLTMVILCACIICSVLLHALLHWTVMFSEVVLFLYNDLCTGRHDVFSDVSDCLM